MAKEIQVFTSVESIACRGQSFGFETVAAETIGLRILARGIRYRPAGKIATPPSGLPLTVDDNSCPSVVDLIKDSTDAIQNSQIETLSPLHGSA